MSVPDEIQHLDPEVSPFDVLASLDRTLRLARLAMRAQLATLIHDAKQDDGEQYLTEAVSHLWCAREALIASVESAS